MTGLTSFFKNLFRVNPIIVKELRSRMRGGRAFITLTLILLLMGLAMYAMLQIILANARYTSVMSPQIGQILFSALAFLELFMICAVTPAITAGAISGEKEKQTYEMLMATPLSPSRVLWGKLISAMSYVFLLLFAAIPMASLVFIFGGVAPREMIKTLLVLIFIAISYGILGLFMSALFGRTGRATVASFIMVVGLMMGPLFLAILVGVLRQGEPPRWILAPSPISALSSTLVSGNGMVPGTDFFYILSGVFNMGVNTVSQTSIPRPLYHYTLPFYGVLSIVLYLISTRLVQPTRRWSIRRKELLVGLLILLVTCGALVGGYALTTRHYEQAKNPNFVPTQGPFMMGPVPAIAEERAVAVAGPGPTPTPVDPPTAEKPGVNAETTPAAEFDEAAQAEIYSEIARRYYTLDHTFGDKSPEWPQLYLIYVTNDGVGDATNTRGEPAKLSEKLREQISDQLSDLPASITWIETMQEAPLSRETGAVADGKGAVITFGNIHPQEDGSVHVSASLYFGNLGATGKTYVLENVDGKWTITGTTGPEWIS